MASQSKYRQSWLEHPRMQSQATHPRSALKHFHRCGIARVHFYRPRNVVSLYEINAENAFDAKLLGNGLADTRKHLHRFLLWNIRPDAAAVAKAARIKPGNADELSRDPKEFSHVFGVSDENSGC